MKKYLCIGSGNVEAHWLYISSNFSSNAFFDGKWIADIFAPNDN